MAILRLLCKPVGLALWGLLLSGCGDAAEQAARSPADGCADVEAVAEDGQRRLALIVGVGEYASHDVPDLPGPAEDARRMYELLTSEQGFALPESNVCLLLDEAATTAAFEQAIEETLLQRARSGDTVMIYFAGHGSQVRDTNGDEPDGWDETLLLHDARSNGTPDLSDDALHEHLARLHEKTGRVALVLDSCNSGTAMRAASDYTARFVEPAAPATGADETGGGDGEAAWASEGLPGLVALTAASDGTPALERDGRGIFTDALLQVLGQTSGPLTYAQVARQVPPLVAAESHQIPYFQGDLERIVLADADRRRPRSWDVTATEPTILLSGPPLPGIGEGAELRIYDGAADAKTVGDPAEAKATVVVTAMDGVNATARVSARPDDAPPLRRGDLAVLLRPADDTLRVQLRLRPADEPGGLSQSRAQALAASIRDHGEAGKLVELVDHGGDFELSAAGDDRLLLHGPEDGVRNVFGNDADVPATLWQHARQRALLNLRGEGGDEFSDNETLAVQLVPAQSQAACADGNWRQAPPNTEQVVPLCHAWNVKITLDQGAPLPLLVGAVVLSNDGSTYGLPQDGRRVLLQPGESVVLDNRSETFRGTPPLDVRDHVMAFGTQEENPVSWHLLTKAVNTRGEPSSGLARALHRYLLPGTRGAAPVQDMDATTWTLSTLSMRVEANSRFLDPDSDNDIDKREYTIPEFDIRPYLPDDPSTALHQVLRQAHALANASRDDGYGYKQHAWSGDTDEANLEKGIDCSRAIWYAFTRAGIDYNRDDRYLATAQMVGDNTPMGDTFQRCPVDEPPRLGDVLIYRSDERNVGHVVMVIDHEKRIAWGSHGWDGSAKDADYAIEPDTGVEYQRIKYKPDWQRWDRADMELKRCWRHERFTEEIWATRAATGHEALKNACDPASCR